jgi:hypothetical protein
MRLIDADALRERLESIADLSASRGYMLKSATLDALDAAPTVSCGECVYNRKGKKGPRGWPQHCANDWMDVHRITDDFGCACFEEVAP